MMFDLSRWICVSTSPPHTRHPPASNTGPSACNAVSIAAMRPSATPISTGGASGACASLALRTIRSIAFPSCVAAMLARRMGWRNPYAVRGTTFQISVGVFADRAIGGEPADVRGIQHAGAPPGVPVVPARGNLALHRGIRVEVRGHHEVVVVGQSHRPVRESAAARPARTRRRPPRPAPPAAPAGRQSSRARRARAGGAPPPRPRSGRR